MHLMNSELSALQRREILKLGAAAVATALLPACGGDSETPRPPESVQWMREGILAALKRPNTDLTAVSAALLVDDRIVWSEAFGYANRDTQLRATIDTRFNIGSVSKMFAALAVMILRDKGLLSLDQPVAELLPSFSMKSPGYTRIAVRHLISHSSGFPGSNYRNAANFAVIPGYAQDTLAGLKQSHMKHDAGELTVYCNDGFTMVELLVLELTGLSYPEFIQRHVLDPLGMTLTAFPLAPAPEGSFVHPVLDGQMLPQEMLACHATGSVMSTPSDMMKLALMMLDGGVYRGRRIVSEAGLRDMAVNQSAMTPINPVTDLAVRYGLGWDTVAQLGMEAGGLLAWSKNGGTSFFSTEFFVLPEARLAVLISGNSFDYGPLALTEGLLLRTAVRRGTISAMPRSIVSTVPPLAPAADHTTLLGIYADYEKPRQVVEADDGSLTLNSWSATGWKPIQSGLRLRTDGRWWSDGIPGACFLFTEVRGHRHLVHRSLVPSQLYWAEAPLAEWLPQISVPLPEAWRKRLNRQWTCINDDPDSYDGRFGQKTGVIGELPQLSGYVLWTQSDHSASQVQVLRVIDDQAAGMTVKIPVNNGRDLVELRMEGEGANEELHIGTLVYRPS